MKRLLVIAFVLLAAPAAAGPASDLIMAPGVLADVPAGPVFRYDHARHMPAPPAVDPMPADAAPRPRPLKAGSLIVTAQDSAGERRLVLTRTEDGRTLPVADFPARGPNPVLLYFLENTLRVLAAETGGSPFYLRNRIREALAAAPLPAQGTALVLHPFAADRNRARMGVYASLALTIAFDAARPGRIVELKADTDAGPQGYTETLTLIAEE